MISSIIGGKDRVSIASFRALDFGVLNSIPVVFTAPNLRLFQGRSFAEIASALSYDKEVTVRSLHMRALRRLQELLSAFGR